MTKHIRCIIVLLEQYNLRECVSFLGKGFSRQEEELLKKDGTKSRPENGRKGLDMNKKKVTAGIFVVLWLVIVYACYYVFLPAFNVHSSGLWVFAIVNVLLPACLLVILYQLLFGERNSRGIYVGGLKSSLLKIIIGTAGCLLVLLGLLKLIGSPLFHAKQYASVLKIEEYDFKEDIVPADNLSQIALMDTNSAALLGDREIGTLSEVVSQYNLSREYAQIDLNGVPVKVSALDYADLFKYMGNKAQGVPGYVKVDPVGQKAEYVKLSKGMNYVPSAFFGKDLTRHIRRKFPTKIFGNIHFEIDEEGNPYYIASVYQYTIGVFGGETVCGVIVCEPVSGDCTYYDAAEIPNWVDNAFDGNLLVEQYNWYGKYTNGFWNSLFAKKGCKKCTETTVAYNANADEDDEAEYTPDFGYVAKDGDIWIYTGVTSVNDDASNIGFILVNERTSEAHYFSIAGADENSAMAAAEGEVQEKSYRASFPSLINVDGEPTYVMVLKDASGIVKLYAMVNVESYNIVTTASNLDDCFLQYRAKLGIEAPKEETEDAEAKREPVEFTVADIRYIDIEGNTWVYLTSAEGGIYKLPFSENEKLLLVQAGDVLSGSCRAEKEGIFRLYMK